MTVVALVHVSCDRCPWEITDDQAAAREARSEHAYAHERAGNPTTFTETTVESEEPAVLSDDTHTHTHTHTHGGRAAGDGDRGTRGTRRG